MAWGGAGGRACQGQVDAAVVAEASRRAPERVCRCGRARAATISKKSHLYSVSLYSKVIEALTFENLRQHRNRHPPCGRAARQGEDRQGALHQRA